MAALLIAYGENNPQIPCMMFKTIDDGLNHIKNQFNESMNNIFFIDDKRSNNYSYGVYFGYIKEFN